MGAIAILAATPLLAQSPDASPKKKGDDSAQARLNQPVADALTAQLNHGSSPAAAPTGSPLPPQAEPTKMVAGFFTELELNRVDVGYDELLRGSKIAEVTHDVELLKGKTKEAISNFGEIIGYELIQKKQVGDHLLNLTYISTGKNYPIRWRFYFYKATDTWRLIDIRISDRLMDMFDEPIPVAPVPTPGA